MTAGAGRDDSGRKGEKVGGRLRCLPLCHFERQREISLFPPGRRAGCLPRCHFEAEREISLFPIGRRLRCFPRCHFEAKREISLFPIGRRLRCFPHCHFEAEREILSLLCRSPFQSLFEISPCGRDDSGGRSRRQRGQVEMTEQERAKRRG